MVKPVKLSVEEKESQTIASHTPMHSETDQPKQKRTVKKAWTSKIMLQPLNNILYTSSESNNWASSRRSASFRSTGLINWRGWGETEQQVDPYEA